MRTPSLGRLACGNALPRIVRQEFEQLFYRPRNVGTAVIALWVKQIGRGEDSKQRDLIDHNAQHRLASLTTLPESACSWQSKSARHWTKQAQLAAASRDAEAGA
jgi:hypothetical protein